MLGFRHLIVEKSRFCLVSGEDALVEYRFKTGVARHLFCGTCGVQSYYIPRSRPDGLSVNVRCLDPSTIEREEVTDFDGQNWESHRAPRLHDGSAATLRFALTDAHHEGHGEVAHLSPHDIDALVAYLESLCGDSLLVVPFTSEDGTQAPPDAARATRGPRGLRDARTRARSR
jgi:hypothetical protein